MMERDREKGIAASDDDDDEGPERDQETLLSIKLSRGLAAGKKCGLCTPSPVWKLEEDGGEELEADAGVGEKHPAAARQKKSVSARKLCANLWEVQDLLPVVGMSRRSGRPRRRFDAERDFDDDLPFSSADQPRSDASLRRHIVASLVEHRKSNEKKNYAAQPASPAGYSSSLEVTPFKPSISHGCPLDLNGRAGDVGYGLKTSTELLKVLNRIWSLEEQHASNVSVIRELKLELEGANAHIQELMRERKDRRQEIDGLMNRIVEDKAVWRNKEQGKMKAAVQSIKEELDDERRLRRRSENLHRKLGKELSETKTTLSKALKDLENERKSSCLLEDLCDEFARGIGKYEKEMRELKKNHTKVDGLLLYMSEMWLDERLQMRMAESSSEQSKKGSIVSRLEEEIVSFLRSRRVGGFNDDDEQQSHRNMWRESIEYLHLNGTVSAPHDVEDDDSIVSDLHCFELNMDRNLQTDADSARKSFSGRKTRRNQKIIKAKSLSLSQEGLEGNDLGNVINLQADADSAIAGTDKGEAVREFDQKSTNLDYIGDHERKINAMDDSNRMNHYAEKNQLENSSGCKVHQVNYQGEMSHNEELGRGRFLANNGGDIAGNFIPALSPMRRWNHRGVPSDFEITEFSPKLPQGPKENTLKAKLLEARIEGRHARLKALKGV